MIRAIDYAIRFASARRLPLVLNMSFGVGNEIEGTARIDAMLDSVLAANPSLVLTISAGNDGPGLSTLGFPGSAKRAISVGATLPATFLAPGAGGAREDQLARRFAKSALTAGTSLTGIFITVVVVDRYAASSSATASMSDCAS